MNFRTHAIRLFLIGVGLCTISPACKDKTTDKGGLPLPAIHKGVTVTPLNFTESGLNDFFLRAYQAGGYISWTGDWDQLNTAGAAPEVVMTEAGPHDLTPVIIAQFFHQPDGSLIRPLDSATKSDYLHRAVTFAAQFHPPYLGFGVEVNILYEKAPDDYHDFAEFFVTLRDSIKKVSANTNVFTVFQLEKMKGLSGGLFGGVNDTSAAEWDLLNDFPTADLFAFTTYPGLIYKNPDSVPDSYYTSILDHSPAPFIITEVGWHRSAEPVGWESSDSLQAAFVNRFAFLNHVSPARLYLWSFLYDQPAAAPFDAMGLIERIGTPRPAWDAWLAFHN